MNTVTAIPKNSYADWKARMQKQGESRTKVLPGIDKKENLPPAILR